MRMELAKCEIRSWRPEDASSIAEHANNRNIWLNVRDRFPHPYTLEDAEVYLKGVVGQEPEIQFAIAVNDRAVGGIGLVLQDDIERISAEIGYWLSERLWNRGILTEALRAVTERLFAQMPLHRIFALPMAENGA